MSSEEQESDNSCLLSQSDDSDLTDNDHESSGEPIEFDPPGPAAVSAPVINSQSQSQGSDSQSQYDRLENTNWLVSVIRLIKTFKAICVLSPIY